jgi:hypothetical protein
MTRKTWFPVPLALTALVVVVDVAAQGRGGFGPPEAVTNRLGNFFVTVTLPAAGAQEGEDGDGKETKAGKEDRLGSTTLVEESSAADQPSLLYLYDDQPKREQFEATLFANESLGIALRCFRCGRVDVTKDDEAMAEFGKHLPLFVAYDAKGKRIGQVEMKDYKATTNALDQLLGKAAKRGTKLSMDAFTKAYRSFLNEVSVLEGRKRDLAGKQERAVDAPDKLKKLEKDATELADDEAKLMEQEKKLLADAEIPPRDAKAERVGGRQRGRGGR